MYCTSVRCWDFIQSCPVSAHGDLLCHYTLQLHYPEAGGKLMKTIWYRFSLAHVYSIWYRCPNIPIKSCITVVFVNLPSSAAYLLGTAVYLLSCDAATNKLVSVHILLFLLFIIFIPDHCHLLQMPSSRLSPIKRRSDFGLKDEIVERRGVKQKERQRVVPSCLGMTAC